MERIYFDNAATTPLDEDVINAMSEVMQFHFGNPSSIHAHGRKARSLVEDARKRIAKIFKASIGEIFFTSCATESNNLILKNAVEFLGVRKIYTPPTEHHCVLHSLEYLEKYKDVEVHFLPIDNNGVVDLSELDICLGHGQNSMVSVMHGNNEIGTVNDIQKIGEICKTHNVYFHSDTVQTVGKYELDLSKLNIDFITGSAHKFHGPKGAGFFYMSDNSIIPPMIHGGAQERNMRAGTENVIGITGMALALEKYYQNRKDIEHHISSLRAHLKKRLVDEFEDIQFNGAQKENYMHHILSVSFPPSPKADLLMFNLDISGISASSGSACSSGVESDSHVLTHINHPPERKTIRFSFSKYNTIEEVDAVIEKLKGITPQKQSNV